MKVKRIRIENFRSFRDETITINRYSCFVGPNGVGKSTVLAALNVFFQDKNSSSTDVSKLIDEDYFNKDTSTPIRITITFDDLNEQAQEKLAAYVRQNEISVTAEAVFDPQLGRGEIRHYGQRLGMEPFRRFFDASKAGARAAELSEIYDELRRVYTDLPAARSKDDRAHALQQYESEHPDVCVLIPSADDFYGVNSTGKLAEFVQWVYVPAVKDASEEGQEARNTALGKLIARTVRTRTDFETDLDQLRTETLTKYRELMDKNQTALTDVSKALKRRLESWAHPNVQLDMEWLSDPEKAVSLQQPVAGIRTGDGAFVGSLARMGHGLQRSYLLALLQELAGSELEDAPTLILGCEEPELYQHPPQARHMADVFAELVQENNQIIVTTHSPLFVSGEGFENVRLVCRNGDEVGTTVKSLTFDGLCTRLREVLGEDPRRRTEGLVAKIHQALQPNVAEMFFARVPILVEGLEDVSYITTELHLSGKWIEFRRQGCHFIAVNGKDKLIQPLAIAKELGMPIFVVFDSDGDTSHPEHRKKHEKDNKALIELLDSQCPAFPAIDTYGVNHVIWTTDLGKIVKADFGQEFATIADAVRVNYANEGGLEKHDLFIADWLTRAREQGHESATLQRLCDSLLQFAATV